MGWSGCETIDHPDREIEFRRENERLRSRIAQLGAAIRKHRDDLMRDGIWTATSADRELWKEVEG